MMSTKFLEIKKNSIYTRWEDLLSEFLFETTIYRFIKGQINYSVNITDPISNMFLQLSFKDALVLIYYACCKVQLQTPELLPTKFATHVVYHKDYPETIPDKFTYLFETYRLNQFIDVDKIMSTIHYTSEIFVNQDTFSDYITTLFSSLLRDIRYTCQQGNDVAIRAMKKLYAKLICKQSHELSLSTHTDYQSWLADDDHIDYYNLIKYYNENNADYSALLKTLLEKVFPVTEGMADLIGSTEYLEHIYASLRNLFVQLCSYNVVFLDTARDKNEYLVISNMKSHCDPDQHYEGTLPIINDLNICEYSNRADELKIYLDLSRNIKIKQSIKEILTADQWLVVSLIQKHKSYLNVKSGMEIYLIKEGTVNG